MRIAIVGGGTAGHMALAHVSHHMPDAELLHIFDSQRSTIGVGEGTTPDFVHWLGTIGVTIDDLNRHCQATHKRGLRFEGWGKHQSEFDHEFLPRSQQAVHFSAAKLPELLASRSSFDLVDDSVQDIDVSHERSVITTVGGKCIDADLVIDARGFQLDESVEVHRCDWITTDSALVTKVPEIQESTITRAIARPLGWIFCIPLANETSLGYVYNSRLCTQADASQDFQVFLNEYRVSTVGMSRNWGTSFRHLGFPNFVRRNIFDGKVLRIGNCASFLEPLEATAIGVITLQMHLLLHWRELLNQGMPSPLAINRINRLHEDTLLKVSIFIAWHYAAGSEYDTPFWQLAALRFRQLTQIPSLDKVFQQFTAIQNRASQISAATLAELDSADDLANHSLSDLHRETFGGYTTLSFAQIANGLGGDASQQESDPARKLKRA